jgi:hypothetical protein
MTPTDLNPTTETRADARRSYYDPNAGRPNLHVITGQHVTRLLYAGFPNTGAAQNPTTGGSQDGNGAALNNLGNLAFGPNIVSPSSKKRDPSSSNLRIIGVEVSFF